MGKKRPWYMSSSNAENLSRTVKGFFTVGLVSAIVLVSEVFGFSLLESDVNSIIDSLAEVIVAIGVLGGAIYGFFGAVMKVVNKLRK